MNIEHFIGMANGMICKGIRHRDFTWAIQVTLVVVTLYSLVTDTVNLVMAIEKEDETMTVVVVVVEVVVATC